MPREIQESLPNKKRDNLLKMLEINKQNFFDIIVGQLQRKKSIGLFEDKFCTDLNPDCFTCSINELCKKYKKWTAYQIWKEEVII